MLVLECKTKCQADTTNGLFYWAYIATYDRNFSQSQGYDERKCYNNSLNLNFENRISSKGKLMTM